MGIFDNVIKAGASLFGATDGTKDRGVRMVTTLDGQQVEFKDLPYGELFINEEGQKVRKLIKQPTVIENPQQMQTWLKQLDSVAPPAISVALQSQMETLNTVFSATLAGMAIDNMLFSLQKSLQVATDEEQRTALRDNFCMMIQNFVFVNEAKLLYATEESRMAAAQMMGQAGAKLMSCAVNMGMECIKAVQMATDAYAAENGAKAASQTMTKKITTSDVPPATKNPFEGEEAEKFFGELAKSLAKKKILEEKQAEFDKMMVNLFPMFDRYYEMIGPSVLITGLLERYTDRIVEKFAIKRYTGVISRIKEYQPPRAFLSKAPTSDYEYVRALQIEMNADLAAAKKKWDRNIEELEEYKTALKKTSIFKQDKRAEQEEKIKQQEKDVKWCRDEFENIETKCEKIKMIIEPVQKDVDEYRAQFQRIVNKYDPTMNKG